MRLIVNADDFGLTPGVTYGIMEGHQQGIVTSTTAMVNMPAIELAAKLSEENPTLGVGLHLVLSAGKSLTSPKGITDAEGYFLKLNKLQSVSEVDIEEVYTEYKAQMERFIQLFGRKPTHIDGHHHTHMLPLTKEATMRLAKEYEIDYIRGVSNGTLFEPEFYEDKISVAHLVELLERYQDEESVELMCHPAYVDALLYRTSAYNIQRVKELVTLCDPAVKAKVEELNIELSHC